LARVKDLLSGLQKWPLLLGAVLCYTLAIYEEMVTDTTEVLVSVAGTVLGSVLLGTWLALFIIDFERRWHDHRSRDSGEEGSVVDRDVHLGGGDGRVPE
jgi:hypothetical protein